VTILRAHSLYVLVVGAGVVPCLGLPSPCSVRYYESLTFILLQGAQQIEKVRECTLLPTIQIHSQSNPPGLGLLFPQRIPVSNTKFHEFPKSLNVRSSARHLAHSFQVLFHSFIPCSNFLPRIHYTGFSIVSRSREPQKTHVFLT